MTYRFLKEFLHTPTPETGEAIMFAENSLLSGEIVIQDGVCGINILRFDDQEIFIPAEYITEVRFFYDVDLSPYQRG